MSPETRAYLIAWMRRRAAIEAKMLAVSEALEGAAGLRERQLLCYALTEGARALEAEGMASWCGPGVSTAPEADGA